MYAKKNSGKKILVTLLALVLVIGATIGGTLAWLQDSTDTVTNTFTVGNVDITLKETPYYSETNTYGNEKVEGKDNAYPAIPGATYRKDPTVEVVTGSEDCYLFVEFKYSADADTYLNYMSNLNTNKGWTQIGDTTVADGVKTEVWYRVVNKTAAAADRSFALLADLDTKIYGAGITLEIDPAKVTNTTSATAAAKKLEWTAYAVQLANLKAADGTDISTDSLANATKAWALVKPATN